MANGNILVSLKQRYADDILAGVKTIELRRRSMNVCAGETMWIYATRPLGSVVGRATVQGVNVLSPQTLWRKFGHRTGLSRSEFFDYFEGAQTGTAIELRDVMKLEKAVSLESLRQRSFNFQPPQFFARLENENPVLRLLQRTRLSG